MTSALREIRLYGALGRRFGRIHRLAVDSVAEAMRALCVLLDGFERYLLDHSEPGYRVWSGRVNVGEDDLAKPVGSRDVIRVVPVVTGAKRQGLGQTIVGAVLVVAGTVISGASYGWAAPVGNALISAGVAMMIGGVIQMVSPQRKSDGTESSTRDAPSYSFNGPVNVDAEGGCVPVLYGEMVVGSVVISGGIRTADYAA